MVVLLLTVDQWTFDVVAFPLFVAVTATVQSVVVGFELGPRLSAHPTPRAAARRNRPTPAEG